MAPNQLRTCRAAAVAATAMVLLAAVAGCSDDSGSSGDGGDGGDEAVGWGVDSCVRQVAGPETIPPDVTGDERMILEAQQQFEPIACSDDRAIARITDRGADIQIGQELTDDGCPDDTDAAYKARDPVSGLETHVACARFLEPPHPGDPGGGGGDYVVGDCVFVSSSPSSGVFNDRVDEMPCELEGWFATVVAMAPDPGACPPEALSRLAAPGRPGEVLCLARDGPSASGGTMSAPGECLVYDSVTRHVPPTPTADCSALDAVRLEGFADASGACPGDSDPLLVTGYDRELCLT